MKACEMAAELKGLREEVERMRHDIERHIAMASELATENERLRAELAAVRELMNCYNVGGWTDSLALMKERDEARAELAACREDAERYRWLREHWDDVNHPVDFIICNSFVTTLDADVDAARKGEGE